MILPLLPFLAATALVAGGLPTQQEALALAFPKAQILRREHFLTEAQAQKVKALSGVTLTGQFVVAYEASRDGQPLGVGFFDTHRVRTLNETALVAVNGQGQIQRVEVVAFREPQEYLAKSGWVNQLSGRQLDAEFRLNRGIRPLSGATLTAHALTDASRRCLALWKVLYGGDR